METLNLHIYPSKITHETRMFKETKTLAGLGIADKIILLGVRWDKGLPEHESLDEKRSIWRMALFLDFLPSGKLWKIPRYVEWMLRIFLSYLRKDVSVVNCHTLTVLPLGVLFKYAKGSRLVYDTHELETETHAMRGIRKILSKILEKALIHRADLVVCVSESIARWYENEYKIKTEYVQNVPSREEGFEKTSILKEKFGIKGQILVIYQGSLVEGRGIRKLLEIFSRCGEDKHIVFMGYGSLEGMVKEYGGKHANIHFQPAVKPKDVRKYASSADVGIHLMENTCLNHFYALPNKVFEYVYADLPIIVSDFPEMGSLVDRYACGWKIRSEIDSTVELINQLTREDIEKKRSGVATCRKNHSWELEEDKIKRIYEKLIR